MGQRIEKYVEVEYVWGEDRPSPQPGEMQVLIRNDEVRAVDFLCPCGCGRSYFTPVTHSEARRPSPGPIWDYHHAGHMIHPSVNVLSGCKSHFFINLDGTVQWC